MGISERRENEKIEMRNRILDTAMTLFLKDGIDRVTIRAIAQAIEYSPGIIYLYFENKNEILNTLAAIGFEKLDKHQQDLRSIKDAWERLRQRGKIYFSFAMNNPEFYDLMFIMKIPEKLKEEKKKWDAGMRSYEMLKEDISECIQAGYLIKADADVATFAFWSLLHGIASLIIRDRVIMLPKEHLNSIIESSLDFMLSSIVRKKE